MFLISLFKTPLLLTPIVLIAAKLLAEITPEAKHISPKNMYKDFLQKDTAKKNRPEKLNNYRHFLCKNSAFLCFIYSFFKYHIISLLTAVFGPVLSLFETYFFKNLNIIYINVPSVTTPKAAFQRLFLFYGSWFYAQSATHNQWINLYFHLTRFCSLWAVLKSTNHILSILRLANNPNSDKNPYNISLYLSYFCKVEVS